MKFLYVQAVTPTRSKVKWRPIHPKSEPKPAQTPMLTAPRELMSTSAANDGDDQEKEPRMAEEKINTPRVELEESTNQEESKEISVWWEGLAEMV